MKWAQHHSSQKCSRMHGQHSVTLLQQMVCWRPCWLQLCPPGRKGTRQRHLGARSVLKAHQIDNQQLNHEPVAQRNVRLGGRGSASSLGRQAMPPPLRRMLFIL